MEQETTEILLLLTEERHDKAERSCSCSCTADLSHDKLTLRRSPLARVDWSLKSSFHALLNNAYPKWLRSKLEVRRRIHCPGRGNWGLRILLMSDSNLDHIPNLPYLAPFSFEDVLRSLDTRPLHNPLVIAQT